MMQIHTKSLFDLTDRSLLLVSTLGNLTGLAIPDKLSGRHEQCLGINALTSNSTSSFRLRSNWPQFFINHLSPSTPAFRRTTRSAISFPPLLLAELHMVSWGALSHSVAYHISNKALFRWPIVL